MSKNCTEFEPRVFRRPIIMSNCGCSRKSISLLLSNPFYEARNSLVVNGVAVAIRLLYSERRDGNIRGWPLPVQAVTSWMPNDPVIAYWFVYDPTVVLGESGNAQTSIEVITSTIPSATNLARGGEIIIALLAPSALIRRQRVPPPARIDQSTGSASPSQTDKVFDSFAAQNVSEMQWTAAEEAASGALRVCRSHRRGNGSLQSRRAHPKGGITKHKKATWRLGWMLNMPTCMKMTAIRGEKSMAGFGDYPPWKGKIESGGGWVFGETFGSRYLQKGEFFDSSVASCSFN